MKKKFILKLDEPEMLGFSISQKVNNNSIINDENLKILTEYKNKIDTDIDNKKWDNSKKLTNKYELIHICSKNQSYNNISMYNPVSRSYYKLWEILHLIKNELNINHNIKVCNIAEGPGGFMECVINFRKQYYQAHDKYYGITLNSDCKDIPKWKKLDIFKNCNISYGEDGTGNIYNEKNIIHFINEVGQGTSEIVTADGGFDFSTDFNKQEQMVYRLILCEIVTAFGVQKKGGTFICKFFDLYTLPSIKLVYLLACHYEYVYIIKPSMSRPANSEKYLVCVNFKGINKDYMNKLLNIIRYLYTYTEENIPIIDIFDDIDSNFVELIRNYNNYISKKQIKSLLKTFNVINNKYNYTMLKKNQLYYGWKWCIDYDITVNTEFHLFKKYKCNFDQNENLCRNMKDRLQ